MKEKAPGGFPVAVAKTALEEIKKAYQVFNAEDKVTLDVHTEGHVFQGKVGFEWIDKTLKP